MEINAMNVFKIIKYVAVVLMLIYILSLFRGEKTSSAAFDDVEKAVAAAADMSTRQKAENRMIKRLYGLSSGDFEGISLYYPNTNMGAEEIFLIKLSDLSQKEACLQAVQSRLASQKKSFDGYGVGQTELLNHAVIDDRGNYILFVVGADAQDIVSAFENSL